MSTQYLLSNIFKLWFARSTAKSNLGTECQFNGSNTTKMRGAWNLSLFSHYQLFAHSNNCCGFPRGPDVGDDNPGPISPSCFSRLLQCRQRFNLSGHPAIPPNGSPSLLFLSDCEQCCSFAINTLNSFHPQPSPLPPQAGFPVTRGFARNRFSIKLCLAGPSLG